MSRAEELEEEFRTTFLLLFLVSSSFLSLSNVVCGLDPLVDNSLLRRFILDKLKQQRQTVTYKVY